jgi:hypothetical protein
MNREKQLRDRKEQILEVLEKMENILEVNYPLTAPLFMIPSAKKEYNRLTANFDFLRKNYELNNDLLNKTYGKIEAIDFEAKKVQMEEKYKGLIPLDLSEYTDLKQGNLEEAFASVVKVGREAIKGLQSAIYRNQTAEAVGDPEELVISNEELEWYSYVYEVCLGYCDQHCDLEPAKAYLKEYNRRLEMGIYVQDDQSEYNLLVEELKHHLLEHAKFGVKIPGIYTNQYLDKIIARIELLIKVMPKAQMLKAIDPWGLLIEANVSPKKYIKKIENEGEATEKNPVKQKKDN